ncbi:MAG: glycosyltransferase family 2 protein [Nitriliruptor sp.]|nr:MAG: glycosyltransferase family 2 protein [Nitriliruptor sp.]
MLGGGGDLPRRRHPSLRAAHHLAGGGCRAARARPGGHRRGPVHGAPAGRSLRAGLLGHRRLGPGDLGRGRRRRQVRRPAGAGWGGAGRPVRQRRGHRRSGPTHRRRTRGTDPAAAAAASPGPGLSRVRVAAIVVSWDSAAHLPALLASLEAQDHPDLEVVVVDNASVDDSVAAVRRAQAAALRHPVRLLLSGTNRGFCGGVNDALATLDAEVAAVLLVNPDVVLAFDLVAVCVERLATQPRCGSVQPRLRRAVPGPDGRPVLDTTGHELTTARLYRNRGEGEPDLGTYAGGEVFGASGACVLHRRAMLEDVRWRDGQVLTEDLVAYFDDIELDWRARRRGWTAWYEPAAAATHERGGAGPRRTPRVEALNLANRLLVLATCDAPRWRDWPTIVVTTALKTAELLVTVPRAVPGSLRQLGHLPAAWSRRRELDERATLSARAVASAHVRPFRWGDWLRTWWRRIRGRAPGVAPQGRPRPGATRRGRRAD